MFPLTGGICWTQPALSWSIFTLERSGEERAGPGELQVIVDLYKDRGGEYSNELDWGDSNSSVTTTEDTGDTHFTININIS